MSGKYYQDIEPGQEIPSLEKTPSNVQLFMFSAVTWNLHRIHYDADFARDHEKLPNVVTPRPLLGSFLAQMLTGWLQENGTIRRMEWSVRGSAFPGDTVTCRGKVTGKRVEGDENLIDCEIWIENSNGDAIVPGKAEILIES